MLFLQLLRHEMQGSFPRLVFMAGLTGISNALILAAVNAAAQAASTGKPSLDSAVMFVVSLLLYIMAQQYLLITATGEIEALIHRLRVRLMGYVRHSELLGLEDVGRAQIYSAIATQTETLRQATSALTNVMQGVTLIVCVAIYIAWMSLLAFVMSVLVIGVATGFYFVKSRWLAEESREAAAWENRLFRRLADLLDGFKEVRLSKPRSEDLYNDIVEVSRTAANINIRTQAETFKRLVFSQSSMYVLLGAIVFLVPAISSVAGGSITKTTMALLFVIGACFGLVQAMPVVQAANAAAERIEKLEARLRALASEASPPIVAAKTRFDAIEMRGIVFHYVDKLSERPFQIGPLDMTLRSGDLLYITGGNGSGKSTFMKVLAGLYKPDEGEIKLDGMLVSEDDRDVYRSMFSAIFNDYHLFEKLYGIADPDPAEIERLLAEFKLTDKTALVEREFRTLDLSTGQRKRLAFIVSLLEKRPILLLDEWAADQDPEFRRKFYHALLPALHRAGITIVAVTHDDSYLRELDVPGRRLHMEDGRLVGDHSPGPTDDAAGRVA